MEQQSSVPPLARTSQAQTVEGEFKTGQVLTIAGGHFVHDVYTSFVSTMLPLIIDKLSLSLAAAGLLPGLLQIGGLLNPFIGYLADRVSLRYFVILAPAVTATLISLLGLIPDYWGIAILLLVTGVSVACFHAPAPAMIGRVSGKRVGRGMSFFMASGELSRTVGPLVVVWGISMWGLDGIWRLMIGGWAASLILYWRMRAIPARPEQRASFRAALPVMRRLFVPVFFFSFFREFMLTALAVYLPTLLTSRGADLWAAGSALSLWELAGVGGALASGWMSDRLGRKPVLLVGTGLAVGLVILFLNVSGWLMVAVLLLLGFTSLSAQPVILALAQETLPNNRATANGIAIAIAFSIRPVVSVILGAAGDAFGLDTAFFWGSLAALLALPFVLLLPTAKPVHQAPMLEETP